MIKDNEKVYDEQIYPLMDKIIAICQEHGIPIIASFQYAPENDEGEDNVCTTAIFPEGTTDAFKNAFKCIKHGHKAYPQMSAFAITKG